MLTQNEHRSKRQLSPAELKQRRQASKSAGAPRKTIAKEKLLCALLTDRYTLDECAEMMGIHRQTLWRWRRESRRLGYACKKGEQAMTLRVEHALAQRALGMTLPDTDVHVVDKELVITPLTKHLAPDTLAAIFHLKNRDPNRWNDRLNVGVEHTVAGLPEEMVERMRAAAKAKWLKPAPVPVPAQVVDVEAKPAPAPAYWC